MKIQRRFAAVCIAWVAPVFTNCSSGVGSEGGASTVTNKGMDRGGMALTASTPIPADPISFANDIQPIFNSRCTRCHRPNEPAGRLDLTEGNSYDMLVNQPTSPACMQEVPGSVRVFQCDAPPCDPSQSMLWAKTLPDARPPDGGRCRAPMPLGTEGLGIIAPDEFALIEQWIIEGAANN